MEGDNKRSQSEQIGIEREAVGVLESWRVYKEVCCCAEREGEASVCVCVPLLSESVIVFVIVFVRDRAY